MAAEGPTPTAVTLQFHPDWPHQDRTVIESLVADGGYRSQFVTGISNGGLTAHPGGDRWRWESRLFAGRYDDLPATARPVYGAWNRHRDPAGGAVRFGSAHLQLAPTVLDRTTFCFPDSVLEPTETGDRSRLATLCALADAANSDPLDDYVEAQVHGAVRLATDVAAVVLDPSHAGTTIESAARRLGPPVRFHGGFRALADDLDESFRGPQVVALAHRLGPVLTPRVLGVAARTGRHDAQLLKKVWHCLARFGRVRSDPTA